jgi:heme-degrading monooxygenase HmoA
MITELADIQIKPGTDADFLAAVAKAAPLFQRARGCTAMRVEKRIEQADNYLLVVSWNTLEDHEVHFRQSDDFQEWRRLAGGYFARPPNVTHTEVALTGF